MHPDQFTLINSIKEDIFERSKNELKYHAEILDLLKLDTSAKIQIHVGGAYGEKEKSTERFITRFSKLDDSIIRRLVIENDDKLYNLNDCIRINARTQIPILFDVFHHKLNNSGNLTTEESFKLATKTWHEKSDGIPMVDYSSQEPNGSPRQHTETINMEDFNLFLKQTQQFDFDVMLEIKNKEKSAIEAITFAIKDWRVHNFLKNNFD
jgi:UV DNA damage endonuclease